MVLYQYLDKKKSPVEYYLNYAYFIYIYRSNELSINNLKPIKVNQKRCESQYGALGDTNG